MCTQNSRRSAESPLTLIMDSWGEPGRSRAFSSNCLWDAGLRLYKQAFPVACWVPVLLLQMPALRLDTRILQRHRYSDLKGRTLYKVWEEIQTGRSLMKVTSQLGMRVLSLACLVWGPARPKQALTLNLSYPQTCHLETQASLCYRIAKATHHTSHP